MPRTMLELIEGLADAFVIGINVAMKQVPQCDYTGIINKGGGTLICETSLGDIIITLEHFEETPTKFTGVIEHKK